jgi:hypothetical protein
MKRLRDRNIDLDAVDVRILSALSADAGQRRRIGAIGRLIRAERGRKGPAP